jgi:hypothetical protein
MRGVIPPLLDMNNLYFNTDNRRLLLTPPCGPRSDVFIFDKYDVYPFNITLSSVIHIGNSAFTHLQVQVPACMVPIGTV